MITLAQYFGVHSTSKDITPEVISNAERFLERCDILYRLALQDNVEFQINPHTGNIISGQTFGAFRPQSCPQGAANSSHKVGRGLDIFDPDGEVDGWCVINSNRGGLLEQCGIYIESPAATPGWSHWTDRAPHSGNRVFVP